MLRSRSVHRSGKILLLIVLGLLVAGLVAAFAFPSGVKKLMAAVTGKEEDAGAGYILRMAEKGPFRIMITENGTVDSLHNSTLSNKVEGSTTIITLVPMCFLLVLMAIWPFS